MALKPHRSHGASDISFFMDAVQERGGIVVVKTLGSGNALDQGDAVVEYVTNPSGKMPVGVLMCDVVNLDLTRQKLNPHKREVQVNTKVTIWEKGEVETNYLVPGITISAGDRAYTGVSGYFTNVDGGAAATPIVGYFKSKKDEDGYVKVSVNLPMARS
jgi:hypothetical protein